MTAVSHKPRKGDYSAFALAAIVYGVGVTAFCCWLYLTQRAIMLSHFDQNMHGAIYTVREILGTGNGRDLIREGRTDLPLYPQHQLRLDRYAGQCGFTALGIAIREGDRIQYILSSKGMSDAEPSSSVPHGEPVAEDLAATIRDLAAKGGTNLVEFTLASPFFGDLRVALLYEPLTGESGYVFIAVKETGSIRRPLRTLAVHMAVAILFLLSMAVPLVVLFSRAQRNAALKLAELNSRLQADVTLQKSREAEMKDAIRDLERFNALTVGRENRIIELKAEVNELLQQTNRAKRYNIEKTD